MPISPSEAETRAQLIDQALEKVDWTLDDRRQVGEEIPVDGFDPAEWQQYISDTLPYQAVCPNLPIEPEVIMTPTP